MDAERGSQNDVDDAIAAANPFGEPPELCEFDEDREGEDVEKQVFDSVGEKDSDEIVHYHHDEYVSNKRADEIVADK